MLNAGDIFGDWTVISSDVIRKEGYKKYYKCRCKCEIIQIVREDNLVRGHSTKCINCAAKIHSVSDKIKIGDIFGSWKVISLPYVKELKYSYYQKYCRCRCMCGTEREICIYKLLKGKTRSCPSCIKKTRDRIRKVN